MTNWLLMLKKGLSTILNHTSFFTEKETYGEMGETCQELPLGGFISHLVISI